MQDRGSQSVLYWPDVTEPLVDLPPGASADFPVRFEVVGAGSETTNQAEMTDVLDVYGDPAPVVSGLVALSVKIAALTCPSSLRRTRAVK